MAGPWIPDTEFYKRCVIKCRAVPESERSGNVRALLESHELVEAAVADLPLSEAETPQPSRDAASVAFARLSLANVVCKCHIPHPHGRIFPSHYLGPVYREFGPDQQFELAYDLLRKPFPPLGGDRALEALGWLLRGIYAWIHLFSRGSQYQLQLYTADAAGACMNTLDTAGDAVDAALTQLAAAASGSGPRLPTATELRVACLCPIVLSLSPLQSSVPLAAYAPLAERLLQLEPDRPTALFRAAEVHMMHQRWGRALPLLRRAYEAARAQRDDLETVQVGQQLVIGAPSWRALAMKGAVVEGGYPRPSELLAILHEANAAGARARSLLPSVWANSLAGIRSLTAPMKEPLRLMVESLGDSLCSTPGRAGAALKRRIDDALYQASAACQSAREAQYRVLDQIKCSGCVRTNTQMRKCSGCQQAQYCRCARCWHAPTSPCSPHCAC